MKKTLTRILLSVCVVAILVSCLGITAFADDTVKYTVKSGDTLLNICNRLGVNFHRNQAWITQANKLNNVNQIAVGKVLVLPLFDTVADPTRANQAMAGVGVATTTATTATTTAATTTPAASTTATISGLHAGDSVVSFLVNHTMASGETVASVCAALGVNFGANADTIKALSGITNWYRVPVGKVVVIPSNTAPAGSTYTAIVAHKVVGGETATSICNSYGVNFGKVFNQLKALNSTDNLNVIRVGQTFYLPVVGTAVNPNSGSGSGSTTPTPTPTPTPDTTTVSNLKVNPAAHGTFTLTVGGKEVQTATSGQTVTIVPQPQDGYKVGSITVTRTDTNAKVTVNNNNTFVMPNAPVTVSVNFVSK